MELPAQGRWLTVDVVPMGEGLSIIPRKLARSSRDELVLRCYAQGLSFSEVGQAFSLTEGHVIFILVKHGALRPEDEEGWHHWVESIWNGRAPGEKARQSAGAPPPPPRD